MNNDPTAAKMAALAMFGGASPQPHARRHDIHGLGEAPRPTTRNFIRYTRRAHRSLTALWAALLVCVSIGVVPFVGANPTAATYLDILAALALFAGLTINSYVRTKRARASLMRVLTEGHFGSAKILHIATHTVRQKYQVQVCYTVQFDIEGRRVPLVFWNEAGLSMLQVGLSEEVLRHPDYPEIIVPTFLLAS